MHLIEHKQQEVADARASLERANAALLSSTICSNKERTSVGNTEVCKQIIKALQQDLEILNGELAILIDTKRQHWITLRSIGVDAHSNEGDRFPDFSSHYTIRSHRHRKPIASTTST